MTDLGRSTPAGLRGRLSEVYFPALVAGQAPALARRLGDRAGVDDPIFGHFGGMPELEQKLAEISRWLAERGAAFDNFGFITGSDRDVTEGTLSLTTRGERVRVPVAIVAERRRERAVELRAYYAADALGAPSKRRQALLPADSAVAVPPPVAAHLHALGRGDLPAVVACFERGATVRDPHGRTHEKLDPDGGPLALLYQRLLRDAGAGGLAIVTNARADDGTTCALEYTVVRGRDDGRVPLPGLAVYERGESGLLRTVRLYDEWQPS